MLLANGMNHFQRVRRLLRGTHKTGFSQEFGAFGGERLLTLGPRLKGGLKDGAETTTLFVVGYCWRVHFVYEVFVIRTFLSQRLLGIFIDPFETEGLIISEIDSA